MLLTHCFHLSLVSNPFFKLSSPSFALIPLYSCLHTTIFTILSLFSNVIFLVISSVLVVVMMRMMMIHCHSPIFVLRVECEIKILDIHQCLMKKYQTSISGQYDFKELVRVKSDYGLQDVGYVTAENSSGEQLLRRLTLKERKTLTGRIKRYWEVFFGTRDEHVHLCQRSLAVKQSLKQESEQILELRPPDDKDNSIGLLNGCSSSSIEAKSSQRNIKGHMEDIHKTHI